MNVRSDMITCFVARPDTTGDGYELLQLHRSPGDYLGNTWQIVRGGIEPGESAVQAVLRELGEETGLKPVELYRAGCVESFFLDVDDTLWHSAVFCAFVNRDDPIVLNHEHDDFRWIAREDFPMQVMWASERQVLETVFRDIFDSSLARPFLRISL